MVTLALMAPHELPQTTIILPPPKLADGLAATDVVNLRESMNGTLWSTVKRTNRKRFSFSFELTQEKDEELRRFFEVYVAENIRMYHWDGTLWRVNFVSSDYVSVTVGPNEAKEATIELEGVKL